MKGAAYGDKGYNTGCICKGLLRNQVKLYVRQVKLHHEQGLLFKGRGIHNCRCFPSRAKLALQMLPLKASGGEQV